MKGTKSRWIFTNYFWNSGCGGNDGLAHRGIDVLRDYVRALLVGARIDPRLDCNKTDD